MINKSLFNSSSKLKRLTGLDVDQFRQLCSATEPLWLEAEQVRLNRPGRKRKVGAGRAYKLDSIEEKMLCLLIWLLRSTHHTGFWG